MRPLCSAVVRYAAAAVGLSTARPGGITGVPSREEMPARLEAAGQSALSNAALLGGLPVGAPSEAPACPPALEAVRRAPHRFTHT